MLLAEVKRWKAKSLWPFLKQIEILSITLASVSHFCLARCTWTRMLIWVVAAGRGVTISAIRNSSERRRSALAIRSTILGCEEIRCGALYVQGVCPSCVYTALVYKRTSCVTSDHVGICRTEAKHYSCIHFVVLPMPWELRWRGCTPESV